MYIPKNWREFKERDMKLPEVCDAGKQSEDPSERLDKSTSELSESVNCEEFIQSDTERGLYFHTSIYSYQIYFKTTKSKLLLPCIYKAHKPLPGDTDAVMESPLSPEEDIPGASFGESEQDLNLNKGETKDRISNDNEEDNRDDIRKGPPVTTNDMDDRGSGNTE